MKNTIKILSILLFTSLMFVSCTNNDQIQQPPIQDCAITGALIVEAGETVTYETSYKGTLPLFWNVAGSGMKIVEQMNSTVKVSFDSSFTTGGLSLRVGNQDCNSNIIIKKKDVTAPVECKITGATVVETGTTVTYETSYKGTSPLFWTVSGAGMKIVEQSGSTVKVSFDATFNGGALTLRVGNQECNSALQITKKTTVPVDCKITGATIVETGTTVTYETSYQGTSPLFWTVSGAGMKIVEQSGSMVKVSFDATFNGGALTLRVGNQECNSALQITKKVVVTPSLCDIKGPLDVDAGSTVTYESNYTGTNPINWIIGSGNMKIVEKSGTTVKVKFDDNFTSGSFILSIPGTCQTLIKIKKKN